MNPGSLERRRSAPASRPQAPSRSHAVPIASGRGRSATLAALLSFALPGLGELYAGFPRRALLRALPIVAVAAWLGLMAAGGLTSFALQLLDPTVAGVLFWIIIATGVLRLVSIVDASRLAGQLRPRLSSRPLVALLILSVAIHGVAAWYASSFWSAGSQIFVAGNGAGRPAASAQPGASGGADASLAPGDADPFTGVLAPPARTSSRINVLLLGADSGLGYNHALTDSQIVLSIDTAAKSAVMASIPRDIAQFPLYQGGTYAGKINSLMATAAGDPKRYPDGGIGTLAKEIGFLLGVSINYYAFINLAGFAALIDAVGGVDVVNPKAIADSGYQFPDGKVGFFLKAGPQHLNSRNGLAFVRTREGVDNNDYERARRQQLVLQGLRDKMTSTAMVPRLPSLLDALAKTVKTDFPVSRAHEMVTLAQQIPDSAIQKFVLGPPYAVNPPMSTTGGVWVLRLDMTVIRKWSIETFGEDSTYAAASAASPAPSQR